MLFTFASRNLLRHKRRTFLTGSMIAFGFILSLLTQSMMDGSYGRLIEGFTSDHTGHLQIHAKGYLEEQSIYDRIERPEQVFELLKQMDQVVSWAPRVAAGVLVFAGERTTGTYLMGVDPQLERSTTAIANKVESGSYLDPKNSKQVLLSDQVSEALKVGVGDKIVMVTQGADGSIANDEFEVIGILKKMGASQVGVYLPLVTAQDFLVVGSQLHEIAVRLENYKQSAQVTDQINQRLSVHESLSGLTTESWMEVESSFYREMQADQGGSVILYGVILAMVGLGVLNTVLMSVLERTYEFGLLRALGTRALFIFKLIMSETLILALVSCGVGALIATPLNYLLATRGYVLPTPIDLGAIEYDRLTGIMSLSVYLMPALITVSTALLVSIAPAIRAARIIPVKALRAF